jgi:glycosyltransferase involved in cell wall biosynthesis
MVGRTSPAVVHVADYGGAYSGNFIASLRALEGPCRAMGLRLVLVFSDGVGRRPWLDALRDELPVHLVGRDEGLRGRTQALARIAEAEDAALLHTHFYRWDMPASVAGAMTGTPVVWHVHSPVPLRGNAMYQATAALKYRLLARRAHAVAVSESIKREVLALGCPASHAWYVPNAVDVGHATRATAGRDAIRRQLGVSPSARLALAFGWDPDRKGVDLSLAAAEALSGAGREIVLVLVGAEKLDPYVAVRLGPSLPPWLRIIRPREDVANLYAAADVFLSPSRAEGFPYAVGEALANGLPTVTSDIPGVEWARGLDAAVFFPSGDAGALADAITQVLERPAERLAAAAADARRFATAHLSLHAWAERVVEIYGSVLAERGRAPEPSADAEKGSAASRPAPSRGQVADGRS